ncbi:MAG: DUF2628 domain-containing protein [Pseudomonadota bacterium]|nr:DUF2628 domain-containing protein [Pseudomonadota bacterium]
MGRNADYYLKRWREMEAKGSAISWNWPACLFNLFWFAYRKMWLAMAAMAAALVVLGLLGALSPAMGRFTLILSIGLSFVTGAFGNHLYRRQTARLVASGEAGEGGVDQLRARGGVSVLALVISLGIVAALTLLMVLAAASALRDQAQRDAGEQVQGK